jgi:hypothetical protein
MKLGKPKFESGQYVVIQSPNAWTINGRVGKIDRVDLQADVISHKHIYAVRIEDRAAVWCREEWLEAVEEGLMISTPRTWCRAIQFQGRIYSISADIWPFGIYRYEGLPGDKCLAAGWKLVHPLALTKVAPTRESAVRSILGFGVTSVGLRADFIHADGDERYVESYDGTIWTERKRISAQIPTQVDPYEMTQDADPKFYNPWLQALADKYKKKRGAGGICGRDRKLGFECTRKVNHAGPCALHESRKPRKLKSVCEVQNAEDLRAIWGLPPKAATLEDIIMSVGEDYYVPVRNEENVRIEELRSGQKVFYINVGNMTPGEAEKYIKKVAAEMKGKKPDTSLEDKLAAVDAEFKTKIRAINREKWEVKCRKKEREAKLQKKFPVPEKRSWTKIGLVGLGLLSAISGVAAAFLLF